MSRRPPVGGERAVRFHLNWRGEMAETATRLRAKTGEMVRSIDMILDVWSKVLTPREREVTLLVARGLKNKEVALELGLSNGTVKIHLHNIFQKLGATSRYDLIVQRSAA
jgi:DNA-binding NarL/FixJ family response regulator